MMTKRLILLAPALLIAGCMGTENRGVESVHQPVVTRADYALDVGTVGGQLAAGEDRRIAGWLASLRIGYGDRVAIDDPAGYAYRARGQVSAIVGNYGLRLSDDAPVSQAPVTPSTIRLIVSRMRASVPGCPDWSRDSSNEFNSNTSSNFGCATNSNLAAMVASPGDLIRGQDGAATNDPATSYRAIDAYRKAAPSGTGGTTLKTEGAGK